MTAPALVNCAFDFAVKTDVGTLRGHNEDACGAVRTHPAAACLVVADGVSLAEAGELASTMAVEITLRAFAEQPATVPHVKRVARAVQQANIEIYDRALVVTDLRGMATTVLAVSIEDGRLAAAHVGDCRLYLLRGNAFVQLTKDHTVAAERVRLRLLSEEQGRLHPNRSVLTRCVGRELIVGVDRIQVQLAQGDTVLVCSDGLYNVLRDDDISAILRASGPASAACSELLAEANRRSTPDNVTAAVVRMTGPIPRPGSAFGGTLRGWFTGRRKTTAGGG